METRNEPAQSPADWFNPLAGWEAASRWNRATFDWVAKGWQQWVALMTTVPPHFAVPPTLLPHETKGAAAPERAMARAEPRRIVTRRKPAAKAKASSRKRG